MAHARAEHGEVETDCETIFGRFQHHLPTSGESDEVQDEQLQGRDETLQLFEEAFGEVPQSYTSSGKCGRDTSMANAAGRPNMASAVEPLSMANAAGPRVMASAVALRASAVALRESVVGLRESVVDTVSCIWVNERCPCLWQDSDHRST